MKVKLCRYCKKRLPKRIQIIERKNGKYLACPYCGKSYRL